MDAIKPSRRVGIPGNIDFSGATQFVRIARILVRDGEPPESMWEALFSTQDTRASPQVSSARGFSKGSRWL